MFYKILAAILFLHTSGYCFAQLAMQLNFKRNVYLQYEPIVAELTVRNDSGRSLVFGHNEKHKASLRFEIFTANNKGLNRADTGKYSCPSFILKTGETKQIIVPISRYYDLSHCQKYKIKATIGHPSFKSDYQSNTVAIDVSNGVLLWQRRVGLPKLLLDVSTPKNKIKHITYSVRSLLDGDLKFFFLILEDKNKIYNIKRIGQGLGQERPQFETDAYSRLHIIMPLSPKSFQYLVYNHRGELEDKKLYMKESTSPVLERNSESGKVDVIGGKTAV